MLQYKITLYDSNWNFKKNLIDILQNVVDFGETINTWQWECILRITDDFATQFYNAWDIVEIMIYSEEFTTWLPRYTGILKGLRRNMTSAWQWVELKFAWIFDFLNDIKVTKTYSWALNTVINQIITDSWTQNNITKPTKVLGGSKLKNLVINTTSISYSASDESLFSILVKVCELAWVNFYITQQGNIIQEQTQKILIPAWRKWIELEIDEDWEINVIVDNAKFLKDFKVNYPIKILNIESNLNLDWQIIQQIAFNDFKTTLRLWNALIFKLK